MSENILTNQEWTLRISADLLHYKAYHDDESARKVADLLLMGVEGKVLGAVEVKKEENE